MSFDLLFYQVHANIDIFGDMFISTWWNDKMDSKTNENGSQRKQGCEDHDPKVFEKNNELLFL